MRSHEVGRRRLTNTGLAGTPLTAPDEVVCWHGAMQAQDYAPAKWSIGQRAGNLTDEDLDRALATGSIIRTHVLRPTWHFVARDDARWLLALTGPRVQTHNGPRYRQLELDGQTLSRCETLIASALAGGNHLTRNEIAGILDEANLDRSGQRLPHILMYCELEAVICSGGLSGKRHTYALFDERVPGGGRFDRDDALVELTRRYLDSHGPATVQDFRWWSSLTVKDIKWALDELGSDVRSDVIEGKTFWSIDPGSARPRAASGAYLLQPYDEFIVGYTESRYFGDPRAQAARAAWGDRSLPNGVVVLNGRVAGHWRRVVVKDSIKVEVLLYEGLELAGRRALERVASALGRFFNREVIVEERQL